MLYTCVRYCVYSYLLTLCAHARGGLTNNCTHTEGYCSRCVWSRSVGGEAIGERK